MKKVLNSIKCYFKYSYFFFLISLSSISHDCYSDSSRPDAIDEEYLKIRRTADFEKSMRFLLDILDSKEAQEDLEITVYAQIQIANNLWAIGYTDECYTYLQLAKQNLAKVNSNMLNAMLNQEFAHYYYQIGLLQLSLESNLKSLSYGLKFEEENQRNNWLGYIYACRKSYFHDLGQLDSALYYTYKSIGFKDDPINFIFLFKHYTQDQESDSVSKYFSIIKNVLDKEETIPVVKWRSNNALAEYYLANGDYESAYPYVVEEVALAEKIGRFKFIIDAYSNMSRYYALKGDELESLRFSAKILEYKNQITLNKNKSYGLTMETLMRLRDEELKAVSQKNKFLFLGSLMGFIGLLVFFIWFHKRRKIRLAMLDENMKIIERERNELTKKLMNTCDEVIELAKTNDPGFLAKFYEVYPDIAQSLERIDPSLTHEELKLCAMISLNFSSKDIANFTFVQPKTIQMKKYRLRKKLDLDSSVDLYEWITKDSKLMVK